jgi:curved DNA-binding protein CbpA
MNYDFSSHQHHARDKFDPYDVLDLPRDAEKEAIRQRFRRLTRVHHPDRNKNNPDYDPEHYERICSAYEILSDARKRAAYNQQHAPSWNTLRDQSRNFNPVTPRGSDFSHRGDFSKGQLRRFNDAFEKSRAADPNDRGYGDQMVNGVSGTSIEDIRRARSMDTNMFSSTKVSEGDFNARFEREIKARRQASSGASRMMERTDDPLAWNGGSIGAVGGYSEVSVFDGMMIDRGINDFTKVGGASLDYSDYISGFQTFSDQLPEDHHYYSSGDVKKAFSERQAQLSQIPDRGHTLSFAESEALLKQRQEAEWAKQLERNKAHVLKYRDQYTSEDLLPPPRVAPNKRPVDPVDRPRPAAPQLRSAPGGRDPIPLPDPSASFRPASSNDSPNAGQINNRILDRMMDNVRGGPPRW